MKSVLRSIKPYWVYLICEGKKTLEVGKNFPKANDWDERVYIYCSKDKKSFNRIPEEHKEKYRKFLGKVVGGFVCDCITLPDVVTEMNMVDCDTIDESCLTVDEAIRYANGKPVFGWHISDLKIYDKPIELWEMCKPCNSENCEKCEYGVKGCNLTRPPYSWCYVEEKNA